MHNKSTALFVLAIDLQRPTMGLHDIPGDGQPQTQALGKTPLLLAAEERLKDPLLLLSLIHI